MMWRYRESLAEHQDLRGLYMWSASLPQGMRLLLIAHAPTTGVEAAFQLDPKMQPFISYCSSQSLPAAVQVMPVACITISSCPKICLHHSRMQQVLASKQRSCTFSFIMLIRFTLSSLSGKIRTVIQMGFLLAALLLTFELHHRTGANPQALQPCSRSQPCCSCSHWSNGECFSEDCDQPASKAFISQMSSYLAVMPVQSRFKAMQLHRVMCW